jgi:hypothetical protein
VSPTIAVVALPTYTLGHTVNLSYSGGDNHGVVSYDVRYFTAPVNRKFGSLIAPANWQGTTARRVSLTAHAGNTYCFTARSRDAAGNVSPFSTLRCTAVPLDDRGLKASHGWKRTHGTAYLDGTLTTTSKKGSKLTVKVTAKRIALVASKCSTCGKVGVYEGSKLLKTINLKGRTANRVTISVATFASDKSGTITIKSLTSKRPVKIDGLAVSAT